MFRGNDDYLPLKTLGKSMKVTIWCPVVADSFANIQLITSQKISSTVFHVIYQKRVGHKLFYKRSSVDISPPTSWPPPSQTCYASKSRLFHPFLQCWKKAVRPYVNHSL